MRFLLLFVFLLGAGLLSPARAQYANPRTKAIRRAQAQRRAHCTHRNHRHPWAVLAHLRYPSRVN